MKIFKTEHQHCIVHAVRNTLKSVVNKGIKIFTQYSRTIYPPDKKAIVKRLEAVDKK